MKTPAKCESFLSFLQSFQLHFYAVRDGRHGSRSTAAFCYASLVHRWCNVVGFCARRSCLKLLNTWDLPQPCASLLDCGFYFHRVFSVAWLLLCRWTAAWSATCSWRWWWRDDSPTLRTYRTPPPRPGPPSVGLQETFTQILGVNKNKSAKETCTQILGVNKNKSAKETCTQILSVNTKNLLLKVDEAFSYQFVYSFWTMILSLSFPPKLLPFLLQIMSLDVRW